MKHNPFVKYVPVFIFSALVLILLWFIPSRVSKPERKPPKEKKPRIAIVLDDWGYTLNNIPALKRIKAPITLAVLPGLPYSRQISREMGKNGFEIVLHMPMEPLGNEPLEKNTITSRMSKKMVSLALKEGLSSLENVKGVSNHMGSRATADERVMGIVMADLRKDNLYFLDSYVVSGSICRRVALKKGIPFASRDIFLDNKSDPYYIKGQLEKLKNKAKAKGFALGIGHDRRNTLEVLIVAIPEFEKEGYSFVFVSEVAR